MGTLVIARPHRGELSYIFMYRYEQLQKPEGYRAVAVGGTSVDEARNGVVRAFLAIPEASHLLFLDDDVLPPEDAIVRLMAHDVPIISGIYFKQGAPYVPVAWRFARGSSGAMTPRTSTSICHAPPTSVCLAIRGDMSADARVVSPHRQAAINFVGRCLLVLLLLLAPDAGC